ncbi:MAG: PspA/IM30 family protein [Ruminococcus sp.]|nr:PspA/IM30 family protein [Ruminococcus sp.]
MGVFARLSDLLKANINDLIDKAEDPEKMVKQIIIDMNKELNKAVQNLGKAKASEKIAEKKYLDCEKVSKDWETKAKMALQKGDQDLAKKALAKKVKADEELASYKQMYESISAQTRTIGEQVEVLKNKLDEAKSRQAMLIARSQMAQTKKQLAAAQSDFDTQSAFSKLDRMEEKVMQQEAEADAFTEIGGGNDQDGLQEQFAQLQNDAQVDAELQRLMSEMGMSEAPAQETEAPQDAE